MELHGSCAYIEKQYKLQKQAARVITGSSYEIKSAEIFEKLGCERIETILKKWKPIMTIKPLRRKTPKCLSNLFVTNHNDVYQLRNNDWKLSLKKKNKYKLLKNITDLYPAWNSLPAEIVNAYNQFPCLLKDSINHHYKDLEGNILGGGYVYYRYCIVLNLTNCMWTSEENF